MYCITRLATDDELSVRVQRSVKIIIIIIIALTSFFPRLHGLDGSPKCYFSKQRDPAHLLVSTSICSYHPPHTPSMFFSLCLFLFSLLPPCFCMPTPSHLPPYVPHARTISISPGALCQTHQLSLVCPLALRSNFHVSLFCQNIFSDNFATD